MKKIHYLSSWRPPRLAGLPDLQLRLHVRVPAWEGFLHCSLHYVSN